MTRHAAIVALLAALIPFCAAPAHAGLKAVSAPSNGGGDVSNSTALTAGATTARVLSDHFADHYSVKDFDAKCDGNQVFDVTTTNGSNVISSSSYPFTSNDKGATIDLYGHFGNSLGEFTITDVSGGNALLSGNVGSSTSSPNLARAVWWHTDDTTAINTAISTLSALTESGQGKPSGVTLDFPAGVCAASSVVVYRNVILHGEGRQNTVLFQISNSDQSFVTSENFAALTGTGLSYGPGGTFFGVVTDPRVPSWFGLDSIGIDGNRVNQPSGGSCVAFYGNAQVWNGTMVANCLGSCMYTEASASFAYSSTDWKAEEEGFMHNMIARNCGNNGWWMRGPHDAIVDDFIAYNWNNNDNGSYGFINEQNSNYNGGAHFGHMHTYDAAGSASASFYINAFSDIAFLYPDFGTVTIPAGGVQIDRVFLSACGFDNPSACVSVTGDGVSINHMHGGWENSSVSGVTMLDWEGSHGFVGDLLEVGTNTAANNTLLKVRGTENKISAVLANTNGRGSICADLGGTYNEIDIRSNACKTHISYTAGSNNVINQMSNVAGGETGFTGTLAPTDTLANAATGKRTIASTDYQGSSSGVVTVQPAASAGTWTLTLPTGAGSSGQVLTTDGAGVSSWSTAGAIKSSTFQIVGTLAIANDQTNWIIMPAAGTINKAFAVAKTGPTGQALIFDIQKSTNNGASFTSIWNSTPSNKVQIAAGQVAGSQTSFDTTTFNAGDVFRIDIDQVGSGAPGANATVTLKTSY